MKRKNRGFTLAEVLIAVALIAVLAAVGIPAVGNVIRGAEKKTCESNRTTAENAADAAVMALADNEDATPLIREKLDALLASPEGKNICPTHKTVTVTTDTAGGVHLYCYGHGGTQSWVTTTPIDQILTNGFNNLPNKSTSRMDSTAYKSLRTPKLIEALKAAGLNTNAIGVTWGMRVDKKAGNSVSDVVWTDIPITDPAMQGKTVPVVWYDNVAGTYGVYTVAVNTKTDTITENGKNVIYTYPALNFLTGDSNNPQPVRTPYGDGKTYDTFEEMIKVFEDARAKYDSGTL